MTYDLAPVLDKYGIEYNPDRAGNQQILCPLHEERNPSCSLNLDAGLFNCFVCGGGDAIRLIELREGVDFHEAVRQLEALAGQDRPAVPREPGRGDDYLPRRQGSRPGRRAWKSPWARRRP